MSRPITLGILAHRDTPPAEPRMAGVDAAPATVDYGSNTAAAACFSLDPTSRTPGEAGAATVANGANTAGGGAW